jgi:putative membrane protein
MSPETLPAVNAVLNGIATVLLTVGFVFAKKKMHRAHGYTMATALVVSTVFLVSYLTHKAMFKDRAINEFYPDIPEAWKYVYWFVILLPHVLLAIAMLPFILKGVWHAYKREWAKHRAVQKYVIWVWLYVSVTGVVVYWLLYQYFPKLQAEAVATMAAS